MAESSKFISKEVSAIVYYTKIGEKVDFYGGNFMIVSVDRTNIFQAAEVHSISWQDSHHSFCSPDFIELHNPEHQMEYLKEKLDGGSKIYMLVEDGPVGIVSVTGSLIEDLYVLPNEQNKGYGTELLRFAIRKCEDIPTLWILENNVNAERLYLRMGFKKPEGQTLSRRRLMKLNFR